MPTPYKIVHTTCHSLWGGLEKRIFNESVWMKKRGHAVLVAAPQDSPLYRKSKEYGFKTLPVEFQKLSLFKNYFSLKAFFKKEKPDIVNTHGNLDSKIAMLAAYRAKVPCRILSRHISAHVNNTWYNRVLYKKLATHVFTTADYTTQHLKTTFDLKDENIFSIPSGIIAPSQLVPKNEARSLLLTELGVDKENRFLGFIGRLSDDKGIPLIIEAFKKISDQLPHYHLVIVGLGLKTYVQSLLALAQKLNIESRVHLTGFKKDVWKYYRAIDCNILASRTVNGIPFEGVPQSALEAMFSQCPVVGSRSGGIPDVISHENTGLLFEEGSADDLAKMILRTVQDKEATSKRVNKAFEMVNTDFTIDRMGQNILQIYQHTQPVGSHQPEKL